MHEKTLKIFVSGIDDITERLSAGSAEERALASRLLRLDIDLLSVAALKVGFLEDALRDQDSALAETVVCLRQILATAVRKKADLVGRLAHDDPGKAIEE